ATFLGYPCERHDRHQTLLHKAANLRDNSFDLSPFHHGKNRHHQHETTSDHHTSQQPLLAPTYGLAKAPKQCPPRYRSGPLWLVIQTMYWAQNRKIANADGDETDPIRNVFVV